MARKAHFATESCGLVCCGIKLVVLSLKVMESDILKLILGLSGQQMDTTEKHEIERVNLNR